jgi:hypothetical protein
MVVGVGLLPLLYPWQAQASAVSGKISGGYELLNQGWVEAKNPKLHRFTWREPSPTVRAKYRKLYAHAPRELCIVALGSTPSKAPKKPIALGIGGGRTSKVMLVVAPGTVIEMQNRDPFPHRPYVVKLATFTPAVIRSQGTRQWTVPDSGVYEIRDELAPSIRSWVVVEPKMSAISYPDLDGNFTFGNLAPGDYSIRAYFQGKPVGKELAVSVKTLPKMDIKDPLVVAEEPSKKNQDNKRLSHASISLLVCFGGFGVGGKYFCFVSCFLHV